MTSVARTSFKMPIEIQRYALFAQIKKISESQTGAGNLKT